MKVAVVGLGYVGLPLAARISKVGLSVVGVDVDTDVVNGLNRGVASVATVDQNVMDELLARGFVANEMHNCVADCTHIIICVPTPITQHKSPDLSHILSTLRDIGPHLRRGVTICLESTTYPGTCEEVVAPAISAYLGDVGKDFYVVYSPEREDPGNTDYNVANTPKIVSGVTNKCLEKGLELYEKFINVTVPVSSTKIAELTKLFENIHRSVNIGLVNELKYFCDASGLDVFDVIKAAATKPFGFTPYYPGPGVGGHCIPVDPYYLTWKAKEYGLRTRFIELAGEINDGMPEYVFQRITSLLNDEGKALKNSKVLALGVSYKKNSSDLRESPALVVIAKLLSAGVDVSYHDSFTPFLAKTDLGVFEMSSKKLDEKLIRAQDVVVVLNNHSDVDYDFVLENSKKILDTKGVYPLSTRVYRG